LIYLITTLRTAWPGLGKREAEKVIPEKRKGKRRKRNHAVSSKVLQPTSANRHLGPGKRKRSRGREEGSRAFSYAFTFYLPTSCGRAEKRKLGREGKKKIAYVSSSAFGGAHSGEKSQKRDRHGHRYRADGKKEKKTTPKKKERRERLPFRSKQRSYRPVGGGGEKKERSAPTLTPEYFLRAGKGKEKKVQEQEVMVAPLIPLFLFVLAFRRWKGGRKAKEKRKKKRTWPWPICLYPIVFLLG